MDHAFPLEHVAYDSSARWVDRLAPRHRAVLALIAHGYTNAAIAENLCLDERTVEKYVGQLYAALGSEPGQHRRVRATLLYLEAIASRRNSRPVHPLRMRAGGEVDRTRPRVTRFITGQRAPGDHDDRPWSAGGGGAG